MESLIIILIVLKAFLMISGKENMSFHLYTKKNSQQDQILTTKNPELLNTTNFNLDWPIRIITHGWLGNRLENMNILTKNAYLQKQDYNVIIADWSKAAANPLYPIVVKELPKVAFKLAEFIRMLIANEVTYDQIYLICHSLGGQLCGLAGRNLSSQIGAIFALDPAGPGYDGDSPEDRLDSGDAQYVETIQTSAFALGYDKPAGTASFFPNYGIFQRGCYEPIVCPHSRSYEYFAESINSEVGFYGVPCSYTNILLRNCNNSSGTWYVMGGDPYTKKKGTFYLKTNAKSPFAVGKTL